MSIKICKDKKDAIKKLKLLAFDVDGVLTDGNIYLDSKGGEIKQFNTKDGLGIELAIKEGIVVALISGRKSNAVRARARELGIKYCFQGVSDKEKILKGLQKKIKATREQTSFMGDDMPDLKVQKEVSVFVCPSDAIEEVKKKADIVTKHKGGNGAVREWIDVVLSLKKGA
ncbi:MAG: HAD-IIIA family hydrolase [Acidobacteria bacterium]|nr:HAD-IIIA family hydrolase [Acidobacteriota bacterium]